MPARGRHRRHKPSPVSRASLTVTAGGAGLALPLMGAGVGHAAAGDTTDEQRNVAEHRTVQAVQAVQRAQPVQTLQAQAQPRAKTEQAATARAERQRKGTSYEVVSGDSLSSIARAHEVDGGWQDLYDRNRGVVGGDPDLILPGQRLSLEGQRAREEARQDAAAPETSPAPRTSEGGEAAADAPEKEEAEKQAAAPEPARASAPVAGAQTGTPYRAAGSGWSSGYHTGVDFPVPTGTTVRAVSGGSVVSAGWAGAYGYQVVLRHDDGRYSQYAHLSALSVSPGRQVNAGQRLGRSGSTGNSTGPHLHFEIRTGPGYGSDIDPLAYLRGLGVTV